MVEREKGRIDLPEGTNIALQQTFAAELKKLEEEHRPKGRHYGTLLLNVLFLI